RHLPGQERQDHAAWRLQERVGQLVGPTDPGARRGGAGRVTPVPRAASARRRERHQVLHNFLHQFWPSTIDGLSAGAIYALVALGYTMVYGVLRLINFAHSEVFMVGTFSALFVL